MMRKIPHQRMLVWIEHFREEDRQRVTKDDVIRMAYYIYTVPGRVLSKQKFQDSKEFWEQWRGEKTPFDEEAHMEKSKKTWGGFAKPIAKENNDRS